MGEGWSDAFAEYVINYFRSESNAECSYHETLIQLVAPGKHYCRLYLRSMGHW